MWSIPQVTGGGQRIASFTEEEKTAIKVFWKIL
jgi:hypothetical protein